MVTDFSTSTWEGALKSFLLHLCAIRADKTVRYYDVQLSQLALWAAKEDIPLDKFGKRHMDAYLVSRAEAGKAQLTLHHDAVCAKAFLAWRQRNDFDYRASERQLTVRESKGREPRAIPVSKDCAEAIADWMKSAPEPNTQAREPLMGERVLVCEDGGITQMPLTRIRTPGGLEAVGSAMPGRRRCLIG